MELTADQLKKCIRISAQAGMALKNEGLPPSACLAVAAALVVGCSIEGMARENARQLVKLVGMLEKTMLKTS